MPHHRDFAGGELNGSNASLGVLMGNVFRRSSGRSWRLRQNSMRLWPRWIEQLRVHEPALALEAGLIQVAADEESRNQMEALAAQRASLGLEMISREALQTLWPAAGHGGLRSNKDGRVDPLLLQAALRKAISLENVAWVHKEAISINQEDQGWRVETETGTSHHRTVVLCNALGGNRLLEQLGQDERMAPVLGQALTLQLKEPLDFAEQWPAVLVHKGVNFIPLAEKKMLMGATVEHGDTPANEMLEEMLRMDGDAPQWLAKAKVLEHWCGARARPINQPAPILKQLEPGLVIASGHYRNGILLAPATADWVTDEISERA